MHRAIGDLSKALTPFTNVYWMERDPQHSENMAFHFVMQLVGTEKLSSSQSKQFERLID